MRGPFCHWSAQRVLPREMTISNRHLTPRKRSRLTREGGEHGLPYKASAKTRDAISQTLDIACDLRRQSVYRATFRLQTVSPTAAALGYIPEYELSRFIAWSLFTITYILTDNKAVVRPCPHRNRCMFMRAFSLNIIKRYKKNVRG